MRTPEARSVSLGIKRELFTGFAVSADGVYSRGYNQFNTLLVSVERRRARSCVRSSSFGQSTSIQGQMRQVELGFRLDF